MFPAQKSNNIPTAPPNLHRGQTFGVPTNQTANNTASSSIFNNKTAFNTQSTNSNSVFGASTTNSVFGNQNNLSNQPNSNLNSSSNNVQNPILFGTNTQAPINQLQNPFNQNVSNTGLFQPNVNQNPLQQNFTQTTPFQLNSAQNTIIPQTNPFQQIINPSTFQTNPNQGFSPIFPGNQNLTS